MESSSPVLDGLAIEAVEWLPSGSDSGLVRVRGRWTEPGRRQDALPSLGLRRGAEARSFDSLPDARFGRDPAVWRATYLVPAALMNPAPDELWLAWESGARSGLPAPARSFEPPPSAAPPTPPEPDPGGEVIDRAVLAERRARRAEEAERAQARRAEEALKAVEVLELRSAELERRLEALQGQSARAEPEAPADTEPPAGGGAAAADAASAATTPPAGALPEAPPADVAPAAAEPPDVAAPAAPAGALPEAPPADVAPAAAEPPDVAAVAAPPIDMEARSAAAEAAERAGDALATAVATVKRLRVELADQRQRVRRSELLRAADAVALATLRAERGRVRELEGRLAASERELAAAAVEAVAAREQAAEQVALAQQRAAADAARVRARADEQLAAERERAATAENAAAEVRAQLRDTSGDLDAARELLATRDRELTATRDRLAERERELAAISAELASVRDELERVRHDAVGRVADLERRLAELDAALAAERRAHAGAAGELETARAQLALAEAANRAESVARAALDEELDRERLARATLTQSLATARTELEAALRRAAEASASTGRESDELRAALARATEESAAAARESGESRAALARANEESAAAVRESDDLRAALAATEAANARTEGALAAARQELEAARNRIARLGAEVETRGTALASAETRAGGLLERIAELERTADADLERSAAEQAAAAAAVEPPDAGHRLAVSASLDAAAAALRGRAQEPRDTSEQPAAAGQAATQPPSEPDSRVDAPPSDAVESLVDPETAAPAVPDAPTEAAAPAVPDSPSESEASALAAPDPPSDPEASASAVDVPPEAGSPAAAEPSHANETPTAKPSPARPRIVTESKHPPRAEATGSSARTYPWLRGVLVKLAHDDPHAATRMLLGLVPVQRALVTPPLDYDLTIRGDRTYAISVRVDGARAEPLDRPRSRKQAAFHVSTDIVTLTEVLAGVEKRMGRWFGPVKVRGRRRGAEVLRYLLLRSRLDLAQAARAGARLDPDLVFRAFAYAIHPAWTNGHAFTVAQEITDPGPQRWLIVVRDGAPVAVEQRADKEPDAVVSMTRSTYMHVLRGEPAPHGERPAIRGDRAAVALLREWTERAQGHDA